MTILMIFHPPICSWIRYTCPSAAPPLFISFGLLIIVSWLLIVMTLVMTIIFIMVLMMMLFAVTCSGIYCVQICHKYLKQICDFIWYDGSLMVIGMRLYKCDDYVNFCDNQNSTIESNHLQHIFNIFCCRYLTYLNINSHFIVHVWVIVVFLKLYSVFALTSLSTFKLHYW